MFNNPASSGSGVTGMVCYDTATGAFDAAACASTSQGPSAGANLSPNSVPAGKLAVDFLLPSGNLPGVCLGIQSNNVSIGIAASCASATTWAASTQPAYLLPPTFKVVALTTAGVYTSQRYCLTGLPGASASLVAAVCGGTYGGASVDAAQYFYWYGSSLVHAASGQCVNVYGSGYAPGATVGLWPCGTLRYTSTPAAAMAPNLNDIFVFNNPAVNGSGVNGVVCYNPVSGLYDSTSCITYTLGAPSGFNLSPNSVPAGRLAADYYLPSATSGGVCVSIQSNGASIGVGTSCSASTIWALSSQSQGAYLLGAPQPAPAACARVSNEFVFEPAYLVGNNTFVDQGFMPGSGATLHGSAAFDGAGPSNLGAGGYLNFDGVSTYVALPPTTFGPSFSVVMWVRCNSAVQSWARFFDFGTLPVPLARADSRVPVRKVSRSSCADVKHVRTIMCRAPPLARVAAAGNGAYSDNFLAAPTGGVGGSFDFSVYSGSSGSDVGASVVASPPVYVPQNSWLHFAITINSASAVAFYFNGVPQNSLSYYRTLNTLTRYQMYLGKSNWATDPYFSGAMASFQMAVGITFSAYDVSNMFANIGHAAQSVRLARFAHGGACASTPPLRCAGARRHRRRRRRRRRRRCRSRARGWHSSSSSRPRTSRRTRAASARCPTSALAAPRPPPSMATPRTAWAAPSLAAGSSTLTVRACQHRPPGAVTARAPRSRRCCAARRTARQASPRTCSSRRRRSGRRSALSCGQTRPRRRRAGPASLISATASRACPTTRATTSWSRRTGAPVRSCCGRCTTAATTAT